MTETPTHQSLTDLADRIRASGILGRSSLTQRLFDFLVECASNGRTPKEIEVAIDAFGRGDDFDVSQDAVVRVYVHKLRRKLDEYYAGPGKDEPVRIVLPKGEYRLTTATVQTTTEPAADPVRAARSPRVVTWLAAGLVLSLLINAFFLWTRPATDSAAENLTEVRNARLWAPLLDDRLPIYVVVGDYYIFGEVDEFLSVKRLVRDFAINSQGDFERAVQRDPQFGDHYQDLNLDYLPIASAYGLRDIMPVLAPANDRIHVVLASEIDADVLKSGHVIYVGFFSGMAMLREIVFAGSRYTNGESYDELYDRETGAQYVSEVGGPVEGRLKYRDYGYVAAFPGPNGNEVIVIAGTRDTAVMRVAEVATNRGMLQSLQQQAPEGAFEALYEVYGFERTDLDATLIQTASLDTQTIWRTTGKAP